MSRQPGAFIRRHLVVSLLLLCYISSALGLTYEEWKATYDRMRRSEDVELERFPVKRTYGQPIPWPRHFETSSDEVLTIVPTQFEIIPIGANCDVLSAAVTRYFDTILSGENSAAGYPGNSAAKAARSAAKAATRAAACGAEKQLLRTLYVDVANSCDGRFFPRADSNESYALEVTNFGAVLTATEVWGALRGLETLSQMVHTNNITQCLQVVQARLSDFPRFSYRGLLLDTGRHFLTKDMIFRNLDAMSYSKFNVFHWHIVDDEAFPYSSISFPNLTMGAFLPKYVYSQDDIAEVIEYARMRGIRVVFEFDTPGHSLTWGKGLVNLLTPCYSDGKPNGKHGPIDPSKENNFKILKTLAEEWKSVFADEFVHLGGDEVEFGCWKSNPNINKFMKSENITSYADLENYYLQRLLKIVTDAGLKYIVWQDPLNNGVKLDPTTVVQVWLGSGEAVKTYLKEVTSAGYRTILSSPWYLNYIGDPYNWSYIEDYYKADPQNFDGTEQQKKLVIGGEACMWGQYNDNTNLLSNLWPLASVIGERLWSSKNMTDFSHLFSRLFEMQCRMIHRGIPATPIAGPGFCDENWTGSDSK